MLRAQDSIELNWKGLFSLIFLDEGTDLSLINFPGPFLKVLLLVIQFKKHVLLASFTPLEIIPRLRGRSHFGAAKTRCSLRASFRLGESFSSERGPPGRRLHRGYVINYSFLKPGFLFSRKAVTPSLKSFVL
jgi:hypothetical protein